MNFNKILTALVALMALTGGMAGGAVAQTTEEGETLTVDPATDGTVDGEFATIQEAVDAANESDTINVTSGTYEESVTVETDGLTLQSSVEGESVTIDASSLEGDSLTIDASDVTISDDIYTVNSAGGGGSVAGGSLNVMDKLTSEYFGVPLFALLGVGGSVAYFVSKEQ